MASIKHAIVKHLTPIASHFPHHKDIQGMCTLLKCTMLYIIILSARVLGFVSME